MTGAPRGSGRAVRDSRGSDARCGRVALDAAHRPLRIGHKGAAEIAPGNTLAAFDAALAAGVDMIEFDVLSARPDGTGEIFVAHDYAALRTDTPRLGFEQALAHLAGGAFAQIEFDVDVKLPGYGVRVVHALRDAGLLDRCLISSTFPGELDLVRRDSPDARIGWSVPRARRDYTAHPATLLPALGLLVALRAWLPSRAHEALRSGRFDAIMAHWRLVSTRLVRAVKRGGGELYVWTVDDVREIERLATLGVDGIITNDPRLFGALELD